MLKRAWMVLASLWAILLTWLIFREDAPNLAPGPLLIAYGPLFLPWILGCFLRFVIFGSPRKRG